MTKVLITDYVEDVSVEAEHLGEDVSFEPGPDTEVLLVWRAKIDDQYMSRYPALKAIIRYGVGTDNVDIGAATERGILVCNTPDYGVDEVAVTAVSFLLYFDRAIGAYDWKAKNLNDGSWQQNIIRPLRRGSHTVVGCIGAGRIGSSFLLKAHALGFRTAYFDPYKPDGYEKVLSATKCESLEELLSISDCISIHVALNSETEHMVNSEFIHNMKAGAALINTSRGQVFDGLDFLIEPLTSGKLCGVAMDVLPQEPPGTEKLIAAWRSEAHWTRGRVLINPHTGYYSQQSFVEMRSKAAKNARRVLEGLAPVNQLN